MGKGFAIQMNAADRRRFERDIKEFSHKAERSVETSLEQLARQTTVDAKKLSPVDFGFLRASIRAEKIGEYSWEVATNVGYGLYVEFGTRRNKAQPFLRPAFEGAKQKIFNNLKKNFKKI